MLVLGACATTGRPGPVRSDLPAVGTTGVLMGRLMREFPDGTSEAAMEHALRREGFVIDAGRSETGSAHFVDDGAQGEGAACIPWLEVTWVRDGGAVRDVTGRERFACI